MPKKQDNTNWWMHIGLVAIIGNIIFFVQLMQQDTAETYLYIQNAETVTLQKQEGSNAVLTLNNAAETIKFSNHPYRDAINIPSKTFTNNLAIASKDPINAILQVKMNGAINNLFFDIRAAKTSADNLTTSYEVTLLSPEKGSNIIDPTNLPNSTTFNGAVMFIDSPDMTHNSGGGAEDAAQPTVVNGAIIDAADPPEVNPMVTDFADDSGTPEPQEDLQKLPLFP